MKTAGSVLASLIVLAPAACPGDPPRERTTEGVGLTIYSSPSGSFPQQRSWNAAQQQWEVQAPGYAIVKENLYRWANWTIEQKSHDFTKEAARTVHFPVSVAKDAEAVLTYTVLYTW